MGEPTSIDTGGRAGRHRRFGLVLSGGGARGFAHAGCLRVLNRMGYFPSVIVGVSMGAVVAATYALNDRWYDDLMGMDVSGFPSLPDFSEPGPVRFLRNLRKAQKAAFGMYFGWGVGQPKMDWGRHLLRDLTHGARIEDGRVPVLVTATDLATGKRVVLGKGPAADLVYASSALAGILPPAMIDGRMLVDGGYCDLAPVDVARDAGIDVVIAVNASTSSRSDLPQNGFQAMVRGLEICQNEHAHLRFGQADLVLRPVLDPPVAVLDFSTRRRCSAAGIRAARRAASDLAHLLGSPGTPAQAANGK